MPDEMNAIKSLPDISFIDNKDIDQVRQEMVADYESFISEATGQTVALERSSVHRMELTRRQRRSTRPCSTLTDRESKVS